MHSPFRISVKIPTLTLTLACAIALSALSLLADAARADDVYTFVVKKQEEKKSYNWWLTDWLEKRDKMRMMDLWLALHSPTPFEFFVGGSYVSGSQSPGDLKFKGSDFHVAAFNRIFGLELHRDSSVSIRYTGLFNLRVFGFNDQGTNITLQGGLRSTDVGVGGFEGSTRNAAAGVRSDLYLARAFGLHGAYRHFFESTPNATGVRIAGSRWEGGAFIDFSFFRVFGNYISEPETITTFEPQLETQRTGFEAGARIYF